MTRRRKFTLAVVGVGSFALFGGCGALVGSATDAQSMPAVTSTVSPSALPTVTVTGAAPPAVVVTAPAETSTAPAPPPVVFPAPTVYVDAPRSVPTSAASLGSTSAYFANCSEAEAAGAAPLFAGDPGYRSKLDRDGDGVACES